SARSRTAGARPGDRRKKLDYTGRTSESHPRAPGTARGSGTPPPGRLDPAGSSGRVVPAVPGPPPRPSPTDRAPMSHPKTIFITGGTGLVGSHAVEEALRRGHRVRALVRPTSDAHLLDRWGVAQVP